MQLTITGHHCPITDALREYVNEKMGRLTHRGDSIISLSVILKVEKLDQIAEATAHVPGQEFHASATAGDMYSAIDELADKLIRQIQKHHEKQTNHHEKNNGHFEE